VLRSACGWRLVANTPFWLWELVRCLDQLVCGVRRCSWSAWCTGRVCEDTRGAQYSRRETQEQGIAIGRALNVFAFAALCLGVAFAWDIAYCSLYDRVSPNVPALRELSASISFFIAPVIVCAVVGLFVGQWRDAPQREGAVLFTLLSCIAAPVLMIIPAFAVMCSVFGSCFGD
jgi:hypothetical protein